MVGRHGAPHGSLDVGSQSTGARMRPSRSYSGSYVLQPSPATLQAFSVIQKRVNPPMLSALW